MFVSLGHLYGHGVYFSSKASESHGYTVPCKSTKQRAMFLCSVLIGQSTLGDSEMRYPPADNHSTTNGSTIYAVYRDCQAYCKYLITYQDLV
jgi:hypothetical protein